MNVLASLRNTHEVVAWSMVLLNGATGIWSLQAHRNKQFRVSALSWLTVIAQTMVVIHLFSGVAAASALSVGVIYGYRNQLESRKYLLYGFAGLFLMGLGIRSMVLGPI